MCRREQGSTVAEVVSTYPVGREEVIVQEEDAEIRDARVAMEAPTEETTDWADPEADEVGSANVGYSNTARPNGCTRDVDVLSNVS